MTGTGSGPAAPFCSRQNESLVSHCRRKTDSMDGVAIVLVFGGKVLFRAFKVKGGVENFRCAPSVACRDRTPLQNFSRRSTWISVS